MVSWRASGWGIAPTLFEISMTKTGYREQLVRSALSDICSRVRIVGEFSDVCNIYAPDSLL